MPKRLRITVLIGVGFLLVVSVAVMVAIRCFGELRVAAFGSVMSFVAAAVAAIAALGYLIETSEIVKATRQAAEQQARVATIMEADLRFRIAPNLRFQTSSGPVSALPAQVENIGRGVAVDGAALITYLPTKRTQHVRLDQWMEPNKPVGFTMGQTGQETGYEVEMRCTDSVGLDEYCFRVGADGAKTVVAHPRKS